MADTVWNSNQFKGVALTVCGVLILSPDGLLTSLVSADPRTQLIWRGLFMGIALTLFALLRYRGAAPAALRTLARWPQLAVACLFAVAAIGWVTSVTSTGVANTLFILAGAPMFAVLFARIFLGQRAPARTIATILVAIGAMAAIVAEGLGRGHLPGNLAAVMTAMAWAGVTVILSRARIEDPAPTMALGGYLVALAALAMAPGIAISGRDCLWLALLGFFVLPVSFFLIGHAPRYIPAAEVSLIMLLEAILGPIWAWLAISQIPAPLSLLGGGVILAALATHFAVGLRQERSRTRASARKPDTAGRRARNRAGPA